MSLTLQAKNELIRHEAASSCCSFWELKAILLRHGFYRISGGNHTLCIAASSGFLARHIFRLLKAAGTESPQIAREEEKRLTKSRYLVQVPGREQVDALLIYLGLKEAGEMLRLPRPGSAVPKRGCCRKAFIRGAFLAGGSISASKRSGYHLEINCGSYEDALTLKEALSHFGLEPLARHRKESVFLYLKNAEAIADFLRIIGAGSTLLKIESMRVVRSMRNQVNRLVNCDTANLEKVVRSSKQQCEVIESLNAAVGLNNLSPALTEAAILRKKHPEASLKELGEMLHPPVSKSAMNHRFRQMEKLLARTKSRLL